MLEIITATWGRVGLQEDDRPGKQFDGSGGVIIDPGRSKFEKLHEGSSRQWQRESERWIGVVNVWIMSREKAWGGEYGWKRTKDNG